MLLWSDLCAGGDRDEEAEKRSLQVQILDAQKRNQGLFVQIQIHYASAIRDLFIKTQVQIPDAQKRNQGLFDRNIAKQVQMLRIRMNV